MADEYISGRETLERLVRLETKVDEKFRSIDHNVELARDVANKSETITREQIDKHFDSVNEFQKRMEKLEGTFATIEGVTGKMETLKIVIDGKIDTLTKLVYIGVGVVLVIELLLRFIIK